MDTRSSSCLGKHVWLCRREPTGTVRTPRYNGFPHESSADQDKKERLQEECRHVRLEARYKFLVLSVCATFVCGRSGIDGRWMVGVGVEDVLENSED